MFGRSDRRHTTIIGLGLAAALLGTTMVHSVSAGSVQRGMSEARMGPQHLGTVREWTGYYDSHKVLYLNTDVSTRQQAHMMGINFAPGLQHANSASQPEIYLVQGRPAANQLSVFGSQPGEKDYSPLWREIILTWKSSATPVLITSDKQINAIEKKGQLTEAPANVLLNCPIIRVLK